MTKRPGQAVRPGTAPISRNVKASASTSSRSSSPPPTMLRPGAVDLPEPPESSVPLAAVAHSLQVDARRKFAATYADITQYMDKCEYLFDHDEFYEKSYKSLAKTVTELNRIGTESQLQEREQLLNGLIDWLNTSSFSLEGPTHGVINEHQLIESAQTTRDVFTKMLLGLERLRALHIGITDKARAAAEQALKQTEKPDHKRQLIKMVDDSSFVWKNAAAEIVQLLQEERSKGGELAELYADKIRYLMGELEAQAGMIQELRAQLEQQQQLPLKLQDLDMKAKRAKQQAMSRQMKDTTTGQQQTITEDADEDDLMTAAAVPALPDFNKQLVATLQKELEECRRQNTSMVAKGHEAAAKIRFLTEETSRKDKQIAQLQANIAKLKSETAVVEIQQVEPSKSKEVDEQPHKQIEVKTTRKAGQRGRTLDSVQLQDVEEDDDDKAEGRMKLTQLIAAAKRQKHPALQQLPASSTDQQSQSAGPSTTESATTTTRGGRAPKPGKQTRGLRGRGKMTAADQVTTTTAAAGGQELATDDVPQMGSFWQQAAIQEWTPTDVGVDKTDQAGAEVKPVEQPTPVQDQVDMNEAIEMTKLFLAGSQTQQLQQEATPAKGRQQQTPATHVSAITPQLFSEFSKTSTTATQQSTVTASALRRDSAQARRQRAKTPADAAKMWAARLSAVLFHTDDVQSRSAASQPPSTATSHGPAMMFRSTQQPQQQKQQQQQNVTVTKSKPRAKAGYDLVGVQMHNLAQQAKMLDERALQRFI